LDPFTLVLGVDERYFQQLVWTLPTWMKHKPSLMKQPILIFYDRKMKLAPIVRLMAEHGLEPEYQVWPPEDIRYEGMADGDKWTNRQRNKMLSGFVHVPAMRVFTKYWMKLDLDVVATGHDDWIDESWFNQENVIISHRWGYTKPADQMIKLDVIFQQNLFKLPKIFSKTKPLKLNPKPGSSALPHKRIISWCSFYQTDFSRLVSEVGCIISGDSRIPVPSQDGFMWYTAARIGRGIHRVNMKKRGWSHQSRFRNVMKAAQEAMS